MTTTAREILNAFDTLAPLDRREVAVEILRRSAGVAEIPDDAFADLAGEIFRHYDAEEAAGALQFAICNYHSASNRNPQSARQTNSSADDADSRRSHLPPFPRQSAQSADEILALLRAFAVIRFQRPASHAPRQSAIPYISPFFPSPV